jgi:hypothetical protein
MSKLETPQPLDARGTLLHVGDTVLLNDPSSAWRRQVAEIGEGEHIDGLIRVSGSIAWESARNFIKVSV